jgi:hypothetical protein
MWRYWPNPIPPVEVAVREAVVEAVVIIMEAAVAVREVEEEAIPGMNGLPKGLLKTNIHNQCHVPGTGKLIWSFLNGVNQAPAKKRNAIMVEKRIAL